MRKLLALIVLILVVAGPSAKAGTVCINGFCRNVPGLHGRVTVTPAGMVKADGGFDFGPGIGPTGFHDLQAKPDAIRAQMVFNGTEQGWVGVTIDYGQRVVHIWTGSGCFVLDRRGLRSC